MANQFISCSVDGCKGNAHRSAHGRKGFCSPHYQRLSRYGDPLGGGTLEGEPLRFANEVAAVHQGKDCLTWPYSRNTDGYGHLKVDGRLYGAHRYVCEKANGPAPSNDHEAAHNCGNGRDGCVAAGHLEWKTRAENQADRQAHGTHNRGGRNGQAKLTEDQAREILSMKGVEPRWLIAKRFGVSKTAVANIHRGIKWGWLS